MLLLNPVKGNVHKNYWILENPPKQRGVSYIKMQNCRLTHWRQKNKKKRNTQRIQQIIHRRKKNNLLCICVIIRRKMYNTLVKLKRKRNPNTLSF